MYDIVFIGPKNDEWIKLKSRFITAKHAESFEQARSIVFTKMFWVVWPDIEIIEDFNMDFEPDDWSKDVPHLFKNKETYDGLCLIPSGISLSKNEIDHRFFINKKEIDIVASNPVPFDYFEIDSYEEYLQALEQSNTDMFWMSSKNIQVDNDLIKNFYISHHEKIDRNQNHAFQHVVKNNILYNGLFLCSKSKVLTKREVEYRFPVNRKEWDVIGSGPVQYEIFKCNKYSDYQNALETSKTEMFYITSDNICINDNFKFDFYFPQNEEYDRKINHVLLNGKYHDGIVLCSKYAEFSSKEFEYRFFTNKKEVDIVASSPKPYDIVFISYNEPNADANYEALQQRFPRAKRIHGIKGIHQAHIAAAKLCDTDMFWVVDGDACVVDEFNFDFQSPKWQRDNVYVWRSINPINDLIYGYGGIKLFPREETISMDTTKPDMTTSISSKFNAVSQISNITAFNTDPFNTWKSAFRECAKLASKTIQGQVDNETEVRLETWCTRGKDKPFGEFAIAGACAGRRYGVNNANGTDALKLINDFEWLKNKFYEDQKLF